MYKGLKPWGRHRAAAFGTSVSTAPPVVIPEPRTKKWHRRLLWVLAIFAIYVLGVGPVTRYSTLWAQVLYPWLDTIARIPLGRPVVAILDSHLDLRIPVALEG